MKKTKRAKVVKKAAAKKAAPKKAAMKKAAMKKAAPKPRLVKAKPPIPGSTARIVKVVVTWCAQDGKLREMEVNLRKAKGILWADNRDDPAPGMPFPRRKYPFPGGPVREVGDCGQTPTPMDTTGDEKVTCWWDGAMWVCPDAPEGP